ncbi:hypothetical protein Sste5346_006879 [Sporothrix stenoceras]|uniref:Uncharacterized protein n=1 Tax=Sporothrix stenoceras TaxID=5173 RepID=A0ABR3YZ54_9PEZI
MSHLLERPALGQKAALGTLYNAHTDTFQSMSLFSDTLATNTVDTVPQQKTSTSLSYTDSYQGRCALLGIDPDIGASLFAGLAPAGGSGNSLREQRRAVSSLTRREHYGALHHRMSTVDEHLQINNPALRDLITAACVHQEEFTHIVTRIAWGCETVITARNMGPCSDLVPINDDTASEEAAGHDAFSRAITQFRNAVDQLQYVPHSDLHDINLTGVVIDVAAYSEVFNEGGMVLNDLREAFELIQLLPSLMQHSGRNAGKGEPITYDLLPIQTVANVYGLRIGDNCPRPISHDFLHDVLAWFDQVNAVWSKLVGYAGFLARHRPYAPFSCVQDVKAVVESVPVEAAELKRTYSRVLVQGRMHGLDRPEVKALHDRFLQLVSRCEQTLDLAEEQHAKITFAHAAVARGAIYVGHNGVDLDKVVRASAAAHREAYVLRYSQAAAAADETAWVANQKLLWELLDQKTKPLAVVVVLDCDALGQLLDRVRIVHHDQQGKAVTQDLHEQRQFEADQSFARWTPGALESGGTIQRPVQRRMVKIPCPGARCNSLLQCQWVCSKCHSQIEFGYADDYLYCDCGRAKFNKWQFKCNGTDHEQAGQGRQTNDGKNGSDGYVSYNNQAQLLSTLKSLDQTDYVNILILGETGVGKSTFINALVNYLSFETLDEAKSAEELSWVIPCAFSIQTMDRSRPNGAIKERKIRVGGRDDEADGSDGASATQQTAVYPVNIGGKTIRLIDTPGIGDTRGLAFDKKNMADILRTLSGYEQLHGILILLKSNNARLTVTFNFCMQELLMHLHRSASRNMAFGFTNTRISNYSPGDTFGPLTALLSKHRDIGLALENQNTFCFDSESFRFLAAFKNGVAMENEQDFRRSWQFSREEAVRMVTFFALKTPHQVRSTLSLNGTRQLIAELTKPMADISQTININIKICGDQIDELRDTRLSGDKLRQRLQVPKLHLRTVKLDRPRTVCRNEACVDWRDDGTGTVIRSYRNPCHDPCYLDNVEVDRVNCPELMRCAAFFLGRSGCCGEPTCGHSWQEHLHVYFELEEYTAMVTDMEAERLWQQNESDITVKQAALQSLEFRIAAYQAEHAQIQQAAARFGLFLKKHSITPYNDATLEYLDMLIQEETQKAHVSRDTTKLTQLRSAHMAHIELVKTLEDSMTDGGDRANSSNGGGPLDEAGVEAVVRDLYNLEHFGAMLRDVKDGVTAAHQATYRERPFKVQRPSHMRQPSSVSQQTRSVQAHAAAGSSSYHRGEGGSGRDSNRRGMSPAPVRVAIIGLSQSATTAWASVALLPNFLNEAGRERFQIVALLNTSVAKAEAAIQAYGLDPKTTKAYGKPEDLAADPDVDFVLCSTRVDTHYAAILPSLNAGKDVYVEWPITSNLADTQKLVEAAEASGSGVIVGTQRRYAPAVLKVQELLDSGAIGKVQNVQVHVHAGFVSSDVWPIGLKYFAERAIGGNPITIIVGHLLDSVESTIGNFIPGTVQSHTQLQSPDIKIIDPASKEVVETVRSNVPDLLSINGFVKSVRTNNEPATLSVHYQRGFRLPGTPDLEWTLTGTKGKIRVTEMDGSSFESDPGPSGLNITLWTFADNKVEDVEWKYSDLQHEVNPRARTTQTLLYAYADAKRCVTKDDIRKSPEWPSLKSGAARAAEVEEWLSSFKE